MYENGIRWSYYNDEKNVRNFILEQLDMAFFTRSYLMWEISSCISNRYIILFFYFFKDKKVKIEQFYISVTNWYGDW